MPVISHAVDNGHSIAHIQAWSISDKCLSSVPSDPQSYVLGGRNHPLHIRSQELKEYNLELIRRLEAGYGKK